MNVFDFDYRLPKELIAQEPLPERDASRLLVLDRTSGAVAHRHFRELPSLLRPGDLLVMNRSRVFPARLIGKRLGGGQAEVLLLRSAGNNEWEALVRPGRRLRPGSLVKVGEDLSLKILTDSVAEDGRRRVLVLSRGDLRDLLEKSGHTPLPPYIRRRDHAGDRQRYQTVYAREEGSVAAPTAGLHFTPNLLASLEKRGIRRSDVILHVGPGTFLPIRSRDVRRHRVMPEAFTLPSETAQAINVAREGGNRVVAVGTTTTRVLESAARRDGTIVPARGKTDLTIFPGYRFRVVDAMITNFHLPRSSLLLLVCAFAGSARVIDVYRDAVRRRYRFYSYGDAMLIV
jgi:S-adenosylmethionine:tRNA ribosyltransferase-isomerase